MRDSLPPELLDPKVIPKPGERIVLDDGAYEREIAERYQRRSPSPSPPPDDEDAA